MEEQNKDEILNEVITPQEGEQEPSNLSEVELEAKSSGWTTKEEWVAAGRNPKDWRSAEVWLDRGQLLGTIASMRNEINQLKPQIGEAFKMGQKMAEASYKEEIESLKQAKRAALTDHDFVKADELQEQIDEVKEKATQELSVKQRDFTPPREYNLFIERNPWYLSDTAFKGAADNIAATYLKDAQRSGVIPTPADLYFHVETEMGKKFPQLSHTPKRPIGPQTEAGGADRGKGPVKGHAALKAGMSEFERSIMRNVIKATPGMTEEKYLSDLAKLN